MKKGISLMLTFYLLCWSFLGLGQERILDQYVEEAIANNLTIKGEQLRKNKQLNLMEQARRNWMPSVDGNASYLLSQGGRIIQFPIGDLFNPVYRGLNEITQTNQYPTNLKNEDIQLTPNNFLDAQIQITQPIINSSIKYNQLIQEELLKLNEVDIQLQEREITFQTYSTYYNFLKTVEGFRILDETERLLNELLIINKKLVQYNKATGEVIADVEYQLANLASERASLLEQQEVAKAYFNILLNRSLDATIEIDQALLSNFSMEKEDLQALITQAKNQRIEFQKLQIADSVNELNTERIDKEKMPTLGVTGAVGLQTENFNFDIGGPIFTLGVGMQVNLFDGGRRKKRIEAIQVDQEMLQLNRLQLQQSIEIEITQIYFALESLESKLKADQAAARSALKSYEIIKTKYENDKAILLQVTDAQNKFVTSNLRKILTKYDYLIKIAELQRAIQ